MNLLPSTEDVTATAFTYCKFLKEDWCTHSCRMGTDRASHPNVNSLVCLHTVFNEISLATLSLSLSFITNLCHSFQCLPWSPLSHSSNGGDHGT
jgi:hypothetical protein